MIVRVVINVFRRRNWVDKCLSQMGLIYEETILYFIDTLHVIFIGRLRNRIGDRRPIQEAQQRGYGSRIVTLRTDCL